MGVFTKYLVCYDIDDNRIRSRFFNRLKDFGLIPLQESVFYGELNPAELKELGRISKSMLDEDSDKCFWVPCSIKAETMRQFIGYKNFRIPFFYLVKRISPKEPPWVEAGVNYHERQIMLNKRRNLSRYAVVTNDNAAIEHNVFLKSNSLKMHGNCDGILHDGLGNCYILEFKSRTMKTFSTGTAVQMAAYAMIYEEMTGKHIDYGFLLSGGRGKTLKLHFTGDLRAKVITVRDEILSVSETGIMPSSPAEERKCGQCEFLNFCGDRY